MQVFNYATQVRSSWLISLDKISGSHGYENEDDLMMAPKVR
jgi:hypothetical protein